MPEGDNITVLSDQDSLLDTLDGDSLTSDVSSTETDTQRILEVTGRGEVSVPTELAQIQLGVEVEKATATEVQEEVAQISTALIEQLEISGAQELQTTGISLNPVFSFDEVGLQSRLIGFRGLNTFEFEIPTEQAGAAIDAAVQAGANLVENISFIPLETDLQEARLEAIRLAVQDAQIQANEVFSVLELTPGEIVDIDVRGAGTSSPVMPIFSFDQAEFASTTPILGGPQTIEATVELDILF